MSAYFEAQFYGRLTRRCRETGDLAPAKVFAADARRGESGRPVIAAIGATDSPLLSHRAHDSVALLLVPDTERVAFRVVEARR